MTTSQISSNVINIPRWLSQQRRSQTLKRTTEDTTNLTKQTPSTIVVCSHGSLQRFDQTFFWRVSELPFFQLLGKINCFSLCTRPTKRTHRYNVHFVALLCDLTNGLGWINEIKWIMKYYESLFLLSREGDRVKATMALRPTCGDWFHISDPDSQMLLIS